MVKIHGKDYMEVNERLKIFRREFPNYCLTTKIHTLTEDRVVMKATIKDESDRKIATGFAFEDRESSKINLTSFIENCETSAWGRALANFGIGIDTSVASSDEVEQAIEQQERKPQSENATQKQVDVLYKIGGTKNLSNSEVNDLAVWFRKGEKLTKKEASEMIQDFQDILDRYIDEKIPQDDRF